MNQITSRPLTGKIAVVAGASRGCGKGLAAALGDAGATVYVAARTTQSGPAPVDNAPGTIEAVADEVSRRGGHGIPARVDFSKEEEVSAFFAGISRLDILACAVWGGNERGLDPAWRKPFWEQPARSWSEFIDAGPRAFWLAAHGASGVMARQGSPGLVVGITEPILEDAFEAQQSSMQDTFSHLGHYSINRLIARLAKDASNADIAILGLMPGFMRTERVRMHLNTMDESAREQFRYDLAESPEYAGRAVVALAGDPGVKQRAGQLHYVAELAAEFGFTDTDGKQVGNFYRLLGLVK